MSEVVRPKVTICPPADESTPRHPSVSQGLDEEGFDGHDYAAMPTGTVPGVLTDVRRRRRPKR